MRIPIRNRAQALDAKLAPALTTKARRNGPTAVKYDRWPMAEPCEATHVERIVERLRRDHPDPAMRAKLYAGDKLDAYVRALMTEVDDAALVARVVAAVRKAEDGTVGPMTSSGE